MERESFENTEVAEILNKNFISIKVDREERPDIDHIYMLFCQALAGQGGWPLTIFMTPDKKPFFAGTYFPRISKYGHPGLMDILPKIAGMWLENKSDIENSGSEILKAVQDSIEFQQESDIPEDSEDKVFNQLVRMFDDRYGGFGSAPKFPMPHYFFFLLRYYKITKNKKILNMVEKTLNSMYKGGIFDHIGFGFARYSTDNKWLVPHFEKMLYDNALLIIAYIEAYQATGNDNYARIADKIIAYILRDMTSPEGGFYSAEDADSEGVEGKFYIWTMDEIKEILGKEDGKVFCKYYDITSRGNFEGKNIPNLIDNHIEEDKLLSKKLEACRERLFKYREKRVHPHKDDKILTAWNGLAIAAMAYAGRVMSNSNYIYAGKNAAEFILNNLVGEDGRLFARYREGHAAYSGTLDDYTFLIWGLIELYEATFDSIYLEKALEFNNKMIDYFWDKENGGLTISEKNTQDLILNPKGGYDGAIPSGNSVATMNMLRLAKLTGNQELEEYAQRQFSVFGKNVAQNPVAHIYLITAFLFANSPVKEIIISGDDEAAAQNMIYEINKRFLPFSTVVLNTGDERLYKLAPFIKEQGQLQKGKATAYICENFKCNAPTDDREEFINLLDE